MQIMSQNAAGSETTGSDRSQAQQPAVGQPVDIEHDLANGFAARLIREKANQLVGRLGFTKSDREDLEQELKLRLWMRSHKFDPAKRHWNVFVTTVVERHVASILQRAGRTKRSADSPPVSLSELVADGDDLLVELGATIGPEHREALTGRYCDSDVNLSDLKFDVEHVLAGLPDDLRRLCELLKVHCVTDAAQLLGIPRTTASSMITRLRETFAQAGLGEFLPDSSSAQDETR